MSKRFTTINGSDFTQMVIAGAAHLEANAQQVNALNVFPVPDGDTGTNMNLTMISGRDELARRTSGHLGKSAEVLSKGLLMGARGNSGVILSQLFRGFAKGVQELEQAGPLQFAAALQQGVDTAYKAVVKPVEGTILTVAKEAARHAVSIARRNADITELMTEVLSAAKQALARTPEMLPILKQVGVVDAGGQGLVFVYEGFLQSLKGEAADPVVTVPTGAVTGKPQVNEPYAEHSKSVQSMLSTQDIEHGYCTEFMVRLVPGKTEGLTFQESAFRQELSQYGDSLLVVAVDEIVKIHIHAEYPGTVMNHAMRYGDLTRIKIENMREQHTHILEQDEVEAGVPAEAVPAAVQEAAPLAPYGFVAISAGSGITAIFESLGVDVVLAGGQTMNPSTEEIVRAVEQVQAQTVFVLPNNSNIVLAAEQAKELVENKTVIVIPAKTIPQGMAALLAFKEKVDAGLNADAMKNAMAQIRSGQVTYAVRDTTIDGISIKEGDFLGIAESKIIAATPDQIETCRAVIDAIMEDESEIVTIYTGEQAADEVTDAIIRYMEETYPEVEIDVQDGGQPVYAYLFSAE